MIIAVTNAISIMTRKVNKYMTRKAISIMTRKVTPNCLLDI